MCLPSGLASLRVLRTIDNCSSLSSIVASCRDLIQDSSLLPFCRLWPAFPTVLLSDTWSQRMHQNRSLFSSEFSHSFTFQRAAMAIAAITNYDQMIKSLGKPTTQCTGLKRQESQKIRIISPNSMCNKSATNRSNGVLALCSSHHARKTSYFPFRARKQHYRRCIDKRLPIRVLTELDVE